MELLNPHPESLVEICLEYPYLQARYEEFRTWLDKPNLVDRRHVQQLLSFERPRKLYEVNTGEHVDHWQRRLVAKFTRNLATVNRDLVAPLFDLTVAARSIVDDNYGWEVWDLAGKYAFQQEQTDLPTIEDLPLTKFGSTPSGFAYAGGSPARNAVLVRWVSRRGRKRRSQVNGRAS